MKKTLFTFFTMSLLALSFNFSMVAQGVDCGTAETVMAGDYTSDMLSGTGAANLCLDDPAMEQNDDGLDGTAAAWYTYTPDDNYNVTVSSNNSGGIDTRLFIFTGACESLECLVVNDDIDGAGGNYSSEVSFDVISGETYLIEWDDRWETTAFDWSLIEVDSVPPTDCSIYTGGPWTDFNGTFGGAPLADNDGVCPTNQLDGFEVWANEAYTVDGFIQGTEYTFSMCTGPGAGTWNAEIVIMDTLFNVIEGPIAGCTITWTCDADGTYLIGINEAGECGQESTNIATDNGFPTLTCSGEDVNCDTYSGGPWVDFNTTFGGAPIADNEGICPSNQLDGFEVWANEAYTVDGFVQGTQYLFSMCEGPGAGSWNPEIVIMDTLFNIIEGPVEGCSIMWTCGADGTYLIGVNEVGVCGSQSTNLSTDNGYPTLTCGSFIDTDGDGVYDEEDCAPEDILVYAGAPCNDSLANTVNDVILEDCSCAGEPIIECGTTWYDTGGLDNEYQSGENYTAIMCPDVDGDVITVTFLSFNTEEGYDYLEVFNGSSTEAPSLGVFSGAIEIGPFMSSSETGCLTFLFTSDGTVTAPGWEAEVSCAPAPDCFAPSTIIVDSLTTEGGQISWLENGDAESWLIEIVLAGDTATGVGFPISENPYTVSGLSDFTTYDVYVSAQCDTLGTSTWTGPATFTTLALPPSNNLCSDAIAVSCDDIINGDTSHDDVTDTGNEEARDLWYTFTGSGIPQTVTLSLCGSLYDTKITVLDSCGGNILAVNDDFCGLQSELEFPSDGTSTYTIAVEGYNATSMGQFTLTVTCAEFITPPNNNDCINATSLTIGTPLLGEDNTNATANINNPDCDLFGSIADLWYTFEAPADGSVLVSTTLGTAMDAGIAVYEGLCDSLVSIACSDEVGANSIELSGLTEGNTYYVQVWNNGSDEEGTFDIEISIFEVDCSIYSAGPWTNFNTIFDGAPVMDNEGDCPYNQITDFEVWANEAYTVDGFEEGVVYTFDMCDGPGAGSWQPEIVIMDTLFNIIEGPVEDCSISWTCAASGTYLIGINEAGVCGPESTNLGTDNGYPALTCTGTPSVGEVESGIEVSIYPNPVKDMLNIEIDGLSSSDATIKIISVQGQIIFNEIVSNANGKKQTIDVSSFAHGIYLLEVRDNNSIITERIIIQ